jgi:monoamine oxidase
MSGAELEHISTLDSARYADTDINWRIREGYGAAIAAVSGTDLPVSFNCAASEIDHSGMRLRIKTSQGEIAARAIILTIPPTLLLSGALRFHPDLPQKREAAGGLPLGVADKLYIAIDEPDDFPIDGHLFGRIDRRETASYHLRPFGRAVIEAYFGGALARSLEAEGPEAFFGFACDELACLFGDAIRKRLHFIVATSWAQDPWSLGSYSYARPGHADDRQKLAETVDERLFFAGEACSSHYFSTAHGAYETGLEAAEQALIAIDMKVKKTAS